MRQATRTPRRKVSPNGAEFSRALQHCPVWRSTDLASCQNLHSRFHEHKLGGRPRSGLPACAEWVHAPEGQAGMEGLPGMPFWLAVTTLATTLRSFHLTFPWPCPSVINTLPSGSVTTTTTGDFSPSASLPRDPRISDGKVAHVTVTVPSHPGIQARSEERRVGKECRSRWAMYV